MTTMTEEPAVTITKKQSSLLTEHFDGTKDTPLYVGIEDVNGNAYDILLSPGSAAGEFGGYYYMQATVYNVKEDLELQGYVGFNPTLGRLAYTERFRAGELKPIFVSKKLASVAFITGMR